MRDERGAVTVITSIIISAIIAGMAIVADIGFLYQEKRQLQTAVDSATLAGTMELAEGGSQLDAEAIASVYLSKNTNVPPSQREFMYPEENAFSVRSQTNRDIFFGQIFGISDAKVEASAVGKYGNASAVGDLVPIAVPASKIPGHIGPENLATFEFGEDRPLDPFSISYEQVGNMVTYTMSYINTRNNSVNLELWSPLASGATYVDGSASSAGVFDGVDVRWSFNGITSGDNRTVTYIVQTTSNPATTAFADNGVGQNEQAFDKNSQEGYFWLTDFNGGPNGVPELADWIVGGYPELVSVGNVASGPGVNATLGSALDARLSAKPEMILPVYDYTEGSGNNGIYHVTGFAKFILIGFEVNGNPKSLTGYFIDGAVAPGSGLPGADDFGVQAIWLTE